MRNFEDFRDVAVMGSKLLYVPSIELLARLYETKVYLLSLSAFDMFLLAFPIAEPCEKSSERLRHLDMSIP